jgi:hypothetical protein
MWTIEKEVDERVQGVQLGSHPVVARLVIVWNMHGGAAGPVAHVWNMHRGAAGPVAHLVAVLQVHVVPAGD